MVHEGVVPGFRGHELDEAALKRQQALEEFAGSFTGVYWPGYLEEIREGWPE